MKKSLTILLICLTSNQAFSQSWDGDYCLNFEDPFYLDHLVIDTVNYPENKWQLGHPNKVTFSNAYSEPNVIVTDSINFYPVNNTSSFIIKNLALDGIIYGLEFFSGVYYVQADSLNDYGLMEFSPDNGTTWIDMINDTAYNLNINWSWSKPVLTGSSNGWKFFEVMLMDIGSAFNIQYGDTILFRFTFSSDNIPENLDGLMYDNFCFSQMIEGISEIHFKPIETSIYPNPSSGNFTIKFKNPRDDSFQLNVYNAKSKLMFSKEGVNGTTVGFGKENLPAGIYFYKLTNSNLNERGWGKFIVTE
jgi:hypothetical protein